MSFSFGQPTTSTTSTTGFTLGSVATTGSVGLGGTLGGGAGFAFGVATAANTGLTTGLSLTQPASGLQQKTVRFDTPSAVSSSTAAAPTLSSLLGTSGAQASTGAVTASTSASTAPGGLLFGNNLAAGATTAAPASTTGFSFGAGTSVSSAPTASTTTGVFGSTFGVTGSTLGGTTLGGTTLGGTALGGTTLGGTFGGSTLGSATLGSTTSGSTTLSGLTGVGLGSQGLGGVNPNVSTACGSSAGAAKTCDAKAVKETCVPPEILATVDEFTKHVKNQKSVRENIARMSSKPLFRIQEDAKNLRQQLLLVSSELQRNAAAIAKLKRETGQELKHAEIALRTKETPPGLQYENTAPTEYFHHLADEFETQMQIYRQQIVETENHLASADQSSSLSPQDLSVLLNKLNEGFIALAAQLQVTHEAVKEQKEAYLSYRRTFHGDTTNVFDCHSSTQGTLLKNYPNIPSTVGPTPFSYMSNSAAVAMAAALNRTQHTTGSSVNVSTLGGSTLGSVAGQVLHQSTGSSGFNIGSTFGSVGTQQPFSLGSSALGSQPLGTLGSSTVGASPFGTPAAFGTTQPSTGSFGFALQKTPSGSKRGKNA